MPDNLIWAPQERQAAFLRSTALECLYGGGMGSGKSDSILAGAVAQHENPQHRALILRRSFPQLRDLISRSHALYGPLGGQFRTQEKTWSFPSGSIIEFNFIERDEDKWNFQGRAFNYIAWDELTQWPGDSSDGVGEVCNGAYLFMLTRLRATEGSGLRLQFVSSCNPGGVGGVWVQQRFGIPDSGESSERLDPVTGHRRQFISARLSDNRFLSGTTYAIQLTALSRSDQARLIDGRWDQTDGAVFSEFNARVHICEPFAVPPSWKIWRGCDDGFRSPCCVLWGARDPIYDVVYIVHELYEAGLTPEALGRAVVEIDNIFAPRQVPGVIDSASFADHTGTGGRATVMNRMYGTRWEPVEKNAASRLAGKAAIHSRLAVRKDTGEPGIRIFKTCQHLAHDLPRLTYAAVGEDVDSDVSFDHSYDALRYLLNRRRGGGATMLQLGGV